jgi:hypothetical protein
LRESVAHTTDRCFLGPFTISRHARFLQVPRSMRELRAGRPWRAPRWLCLTTRLRWSSPGSRRAPSRRAAASARPGAPSSTPTDSCSRTSSPTHFTAFSSTTRAQASSSPAPPRLQRAPGSTTSATTCRPAPRATLPSWTTATGSCSTAAAQAGSSSGEPGDAPVRAHPPAPGPGRCFPST